MPRTRGIRALLRFWQNTPGPYPRDLHVICCLNVQRFSPQDKQARSLDVLLALEVIFSCVPWSSIVLLLCAVMGVRNDLISVIFAFLQGPMSVRSGRFSVSERIKNSRHSAIQESVHCILRKATSRFQFHTVSSHSKRLADRKRQCDEQPQAKKVCPRKLEFEDSIETCVDFSADVASVNHDHSYFCIEEQATPTICCPGCSRGGGICPNLLPYPRGFSMYLSRQL